MAIAGINIARLVTTLVLESGQFDSAMAAAEGKVGAFGAKMSNLGSSLLRTGGLMTAGVTLPIVGIGNAVIDTGMEFDKQMRRMNTVAKLPEDQLQAVADKLRDMAIVGGQSPVEVAASMYNLIGALDDADVAMQVLEHSMTVANAGYVDMESANDALVLVMKAYGRSADEAGTISDELFTIVDKGILTMSELQNGLGYVVSTAAGAGVPLSELGAAVIGLTRGGVPATTTMTSLNRLLLGFIKPSGAARDAAAALGIDLSAAALSEKGLYGALQEVNAALGGGAQEIAGYLTELDKMNGASDENVATAMEMASASGTNVDAMAKLFTTAQGLRAALTLMNGDMALFNEGMEGMAESAGSTDSALNEVFKSADYNARVLSAAFENLKIVAWEHLAPAFAGVVESLTKFVVRLSEADPKLIDLAIKIAAVAAVVGPVLLVLGMLTKVIGLVTAVIGGLSLPILAVIAMIALLAVVWAKNWGNIQAVVRRILNDVIQFMQGILTKIRTWYLENEQLIQGVIDNVTNIIQTFLPFLIGLLLTAWTTIKGIIETAVDVVLGIITIFLLLLSGKWEDAWYAILDLLQTVANGIKDAVLNMVSYIADVLSIIWTKIGPSVIQAWNDMKEAVVKWYNDTYNKIGEWVENTAAKIQGWCNDVATKIETFVTNTAKAIAKWGTDVALAVTNAASDIVAGVAALPAKFTAFVSQMTTAGLSLGKALVQGIINGISNMIQNAINAATNLINRITGAADNAAGAKSPAKKFIPLGVDIGMGIVKGIDSTADAVQRAAQRLVGGGLEASVSVAGGAGGRGGPVSVNFYGPVYARDRQELDMLSREIAKKLRVAGVAT